MKEKSRKQKLEKLKEEINNHISWTIYHIEYLKGICEYFKKQKKYVEKELKEYTDTHDCFPL